MSLGFLIRFLLVFFILSEANASVKHCFSGIRGEEWEITGRNGGENKHEISSY